MFRHTDRRYINQVLVAIDQLVNAILGGWADETISSRSFRSYKAGKLFGRMSKTTIDSFFSIFGDHNHCERCFMAEKDRRQNHPEFRD